MELPDLCLGASRDYLMVGFPGLMIGVFIGLCIGLIDGAFWSFKLWDLVLVWAVVWIILGLFVIWGDNWGFFIIIWIVLYTIFGILHGILFMISYG